MITTGTGRILAALAAAMLLAGCFGGGEAACVKPREYQESRSTEPLEVPAGLDDPPGEGVRIPPLPAGTPDKRTRSCLDEPPDYFGR